MQHKILYKNTKMSTIKNSKGNVKTPNLVLHQQYTMQNKVIKFFAWALVWLPKVAIVPGLGQVY